ncbi:hypothetical protein QVD17_02310 [Tagetes erecta]|uniref:BHLH domain-containing protein n=1 Tax=Tagetes erecta TaxID=13708 RepID=A0AAD8L6C6_TARER|nr:hypothetical protein QVD17_02310 [Tagetes erecta]
METTNFHEHWQVEDNQLPVDYSWYQNYILNGTRNHTNLEDVKQNMYYNIDLASIPMENFNAHELQQLARIKNELSVTGSCLDLPDIINYSPTSSTDQDFMSKNTEQLVTYNNNIDNQDDHMLFKTFLDVCQNKSDHYMNPIPSSDESIFNSFDTNSCYRGIFSQILPTLKISNLPALDPFGYPTANGSFNYQSSSFNFHNLGDLLKDNCLPDGVNQTSSKIAPSFIVEETKAKRPASTVQNKRMSLTTNPAKKSKLESRASCPPLKVRKEKLGDRILALQQMVAPFGKTDTASVLMEAIGYIKFLQNQIETLSMPYMNSTHKASGTSKRGDSTKDGNEETKSNILRNRGLCLVPVSCLTYVTYGGGSVWATL